jgi:hypothetical protein
LNAYHVHNHPKATVQFGRPRRNPNKTSPEPVSFIYGNFYVMHLDFEVLQDAMLRVSQPLQQQPCKPPRDVAQPLKGGLLRVIWCNGKHLLGVIQIDVPFSKDEVCAMHMRFNKPVVMSDGFWLATENDAKLWIQRVINELRVP